MAQALYRKYRSKSLDDVVGQRHITDILNRALATGRVSHAYLFTGPRGVGKTSVARILAHAINDLPYSDESTHLDIIEIDAASNNGVEDVRDLREKVQLAPVAAQKKVYIIDEVHMLSKAAFNALLKTLEEPPAHVVFILATTDLDKLPATIVSRTQRYGFRAISEADAVAHLRTIADAEHIHISDEALGLIARRGDGSFRDSISLLDQLASVADKDAPITAELIETTLGMATALTVSSLLDAVHDHSLPTISRLLEEAYEEGVSPTTLATQLTDALLAQVADKPELLPLIDMLLEVPKSSHPAIKLLVVLGTTQHEAKPKTVALTAPVKEVSATIEELSHKATQKKPAETTAITAPTPSTVPKAEFNWETLVTHVRSSYIALYGVLSGCKYELHDDVLTVFAGNAFYKKKLDDAKYSPQLYAALSAIGCAHLQVVTVPTTPPPKSSQAAAIAAMMGGGEEVSVEAEINPAPTPA